MNTFETAANDLNNELVAGFCCRRHHPIKCTHMANNYIRVTTTPSRTERESPSIYNEMKHFIYFPNEQYRTKQYIRVVRITKKKSSLLDGWNEMNCNERRASTNAFCVLGLFHFFLLIIFQGLFILAFVVDSPYIKKSYSHQTLL